MDIHQLRYFNAVAEELHFGRAAERLLVTPSPLSKQIRRFEREVGGDLFIRRHHTVELTPLGRQVLEPVRKILELVDGLKALKVSGSSVLRLGIAPSAPIESYDGIIKVLREAENVQLNMTLASTAQLLPMLEAGQLDFAIGHRPIRADRFVSFDLASYGFEVGMLASDPIADKVHLKLSDLAGGVLVVTTSNFHPEHQVQFINTLRSAGVSNMVEIEGGSSTVVAAHLRVSGARTLVPAVRTHPSRAALSTDTFSLVPLAPGELENVVVFVALRDSVREGSRLGSIYSSLFDLTNP